MSTTHTPTSDTEMKQAARSSTLNHGGTPAEICAANGWGVGTKLVGDEGYGPTIIEITAVGESSLLAKCLAHNGIAVNQRENSWVLDCRDWHEATEANVPKPHPEGTRIRFSHNGEGVTGVVVSGPDSSGVYVIEGDNHAKWVARGDTLEAI